MAVKVKNRRGRTVTLLNPAERGRKFADELGNGVKLTNNFMIKTTPTGSPIRLTDTEKAYRSGYLAARKDNAKAYKANRH